MIVCCFFCFVKQKTSYEMRISDWSSDVCSSDLPLLCAAARQGGKTCGAYRQLRAGRGRRCSRGRLAFGRQGRFAGHGAGAGCAALLHYRAGRRALGVERACGARRGQSGRAEERWVGKECVRTCNTLWSPLHDNKKKKNTAE